MGLIFSLNVDQINVRIQKFGTFRLRRPKDGLYA